MKLNKRLVFYILLVFTFTIFCACNKTNIPPIDSESITPVVTDTPTASDHEKATPSSNEEVFRVVCLLNGTLGDKGFFDNMADGVNRLHSELGWETKIIEMGKDEANYESYFINASESGEWDLIITGTFSVKNLLQKTAVQFPKQKYMIVDVAVDFSAVPSKNIMGVTYTSNETGFLGGALAALMWGDPGNTKVDTTNPILGFVGSVNAPHINDFLVGYMEGIKYINPDIKLLTNYVGSFADVPKCLEITNQMYSSGAQIIYAPASQSIQGAAQASNYVDKFFIGCDNDIWTITNDTDPELVEHVLSSTMKHVGNSIFDTAKGLREGIYNVGENYLLGIKDNAVGLADNENYQKLVPSDIRERLSKISQKIANGEIVVSSSFNMTSDEIAALCNSMKP